jgi:hypothetical protein
MKDSSLPQLGQRLFDLDEGSIPEETDELDPTPELTTPNNNNIHSRKVMYLQKPKKRK